MVNLFQRSKDVWSGEYVKDADPQIIDNLNKPWIAVQSNAIYTPVSFLLAM